MRGARRALRGATLGVGVHVGVHVVRVARGEVPLVASPQIARVVRSRRRRASPPRASLRASPRDALRDGGDSLDDEFAVAETDPRSTAAPDEEEDDEEEEENETRVFRDAGMEANNDIAARFKNMLGYIFVARCGSEMPIGHFRLPADASVGANVFSEFISSIVPAGADALTVAARASPAASRTSTSASAPSSPPPSPCRCSSRWCRR